MNTKKIVFNIDDNNELISRILNIMNMEVNKHGSNRIKLAQKKKEMEEIDSICNFLKKRVEDKYSFIKLYKLDDHENIVEMDNDLNEIKSILKQSKKRLSQRIEKIEKFEKKIKTEIDDDDYVYDDQYKVKNTHNFLFFLFTMIIFQIGFMFYRTFEKEVHDYGIYTIYFLNDKMNIVKNQSVEFYNKYQNHINVLKITNKTVEFYNNIPQIYKNIKQSLIQYAQ